MASRGDIADGAIQDKARVSSFSFDNVKAGNAVTHPSEISFCGNASRRAGSSAAAFQLPSHSCKGNCAKSLREFGGY